MKKGKLLFDDLFYCYCLFLFSIFSCNPNHPPKSLPVTEKVTSIVEKIVLPLGHTKKLSCTEEPTLNYDLFLPSTYTIQNKFPVIFIFDAHARGHLPIKLYHAIADSFGFVLVASNNSKNGQDLSRAEYIFSHLFKDAMQKISIDERRICIMGFSGGARVAATLGISNPNIASIIGCSAGFPKTDRSPDFHFNYLGIVGNEDFNFNEMTSLDNFLKETTIRHQLLVFNGKHDWPPLNTMEEAFYWLSFNAMRDHTSPINERLINRYFQMQEVILNRATKIGDDIAVFTISKKVVNFLTGLTEISKLDEKIKQLQHSVNVEANKTSLNNIAIEEQRLQKIYAGYMQEKDLTWWQNELNRLNAAIKADKRPEDALYKKRLISYMSLLAYSYSNSALQGNQLNQAKQFLNIYALVDPTNSEHALLRAILMVKYNKFPESINYLNEALKLGFSDKERLLNEPDFDQIKNDTGFKTLLNRL